MSPSPTTARSPDGRIRDRLRFAAITAMVLALPIAAAAWLVTTQLETHDRDRVDAHLAGALRIAEAELATRIAVADASARSLAHTRVVQRAIIDGNAAALSGVRRRTRGLVVDTANRRLVGGAAPRDAIVRTVAVLGPNGRTLGRVGIAVPVGAAFLAQLSARTGTALLVERGGRIAAGALAIRAPLEIESGEPHTIRLRSGRYRAVAAMLPGATGRLVAAVSAFDLEAAAANRTRYVALAAVATLLTLLLVAEALGPIARRSLRRGVADEEESIELLGSALAAAHDRNALLPLILESVVDATGAVGGVLVEGGETIAAIGEQPPLTDPLRLSLAAENGSGAAVLLYPPFGGFSAAEQARAERLAEKAAVAVENARQHAIARRDAATDPLTGLANRRRFMEQLAAEGTRRARSGRRVSLIVADLDDFKLVNDRFGHETGDAVLRAFAGVLRGTVREIDVSARLGGEEFAVLLPETDGDGAAALAGRLRERLEQLQLDAPDGTRLRVTASFGVASCPPVERAEDLPAAADNALYEAKNDGKNRVVEATGR